MTMRGPLNVICSVVLVAGLLTLCGCDAPYTAMGPQPAVGPVTLGPGDRLRVIVFGQTQLSGDFIVGDDGDMSLPLVGRVHLAGLTAAQAERTLRQRLARGIITDPQVSVDVLRYRPIYVVGEVTRPGGYEPTGRLSVINAVALAGGYTYRARTDRVTLLRDGDPNRVPVPVTDATPIGPGDVVIVPERWF